MGEWDNLKAAIERRKASPHKEDQYIGCHVNYLARLMEQVEQAQTQAMIRIDHGAIVGYPGWGIDYSPNSHTWTVVVPGVGHFGAQTPEWAFDMAAKAVERKNA